MFTSRTLIRIQGLLEEFDETFDTRQFFRELKRDLAIYVAEHTRRVSAALDGVHPKQDQSFLQWAYRHLREKNADKAQDFAGKLMVILRSEKSKWEFRTGKERPLGEWIEVEPRNPKVPFGA